MQIAEMTKAEKMRMAMVGSKAARALLVRDHNKQVSFAAISSPQTTTPEAAEIAKSKEVGEEILRYIGNKKDWIKSSEVKHNLVFNPEVPGRHLAANSWATCAPTSCASSPAAATSRRRSARSPRSGRRAKKSG